MYNNTINILTILYVVLTHSLSKITIVLGDTLDKSLILSPASNFITIIISTYLGAVAKLFFAFTEGWNLRKTAIILFISLTVCYIGCFFSFDNRVFLFCRSLQGLVAGILNSLIMGLIGKYNNSGFSLMAITSTYVCFITIILAAFCHILLLGSMLVLLSILATYMAHNLPSSPIGQQLSLKEFFFLIKNKTILALSISCGLLLGYVLNHLFRCSNVFLTYYPEAFSLSILISIVPFFTGSLLQPFYKKIPLYLISGFSVIMGLLGTYCTTWYPFCYLGCITFAYVGFLYLQTLTSEYVSETFENKYAASIVFFAIRTFATASTMYLIKEYSLYSMLFFYIINALMLLTFLKVQPQNTIATLRILCLYGLMYLFF